MAVGCDSFDETMLNIPQLDGSVTMPNSKFRTRINEKGLIEFDLDYKCDLCDFQSSEESGLTIQKNKKHNPLKPYKPRQRHKKKVQ